MGSEFVLFLEKDRDGSGGWEREGDPFPTYAAAYEYLTELLLAGKLHWPGYRGRGWKIDRVTKEEVKTEDAREFVVQRYDGSLFRWIDFRTCPAGWDPDKGDLNKMIGHASHGHDSAWRIVAYPNGARGLAPQVVYTPEERKKGPPDPPPGETRTEEGFFVQVRDDPGDDWEDNAGPFDTAKLAEEDAGGLSAYDGGPTEVRIVRRVTTEVQTEVKKWSPAGQGAAVPPPPWRVWEEDCAEDGSWEVVGYFENAPNAREVARAMAAKNRDYAYLVGNGARDGRFRCRWAEGGGGVGGRVVMTYPPDLKDVTDGPEGW